MKPQINELALFAGAGGGILGGKILGWRTICAVERDAYAAAILAARQNDGLLQPFPIWSDVETFDGRPWRGRVDIVSGGFPCQDISQAGKGEGIDGARSGLWAHMARIIGEVQPPLVWVENSPLLVRRGGSRVLGDLAAMGYDAVWGVVGAGHAAAPHIRRRVWILAYTLRGKVLLDQFDKEPNPKPRGHGPHGAVDSHTHGMRKLQQARCEQELRDGSSHLCKDVAHTDSMQCHRRYQPDEMGRLRSSQETSYHGHPAGNEWPTEPQMGRVAHGVADRLEQISALGNGQVPRVVALAWNLLTEMKS